MTVRKFSCTGCGECCHKWEGRTVLSLADQRRLMLSTMGEALSFFTEEVETENPERPLVALRRDAESKECIFLGLDKKTCLVWDHAPSMCRAFPWIPNVLADWQGWAKKCEGMNEGTEWGEGDQEAGVQIWEGLADPEGRPWSEVLKERHGEARWSGCSAIQERGPDAGAEEGGSQGPDPQAR